MAQQGNGNHKQFILKSPKSIEFYEKNPHFDFNAMNDLMVDVIQKITTSSASTISVNELKSLLHNINNKLESVESNTHSNSQMVKMTYDTLQSHKESYFQAMERALKGDQGELMKHIREANELIIDKTILGVLQQIPKTNEHMIQDLKGTLHLSQSEMLQETSRAIQDGFSRQDKTNVEKIIQDSYLNINTKIQETLFDYFKKQNIEVSNNNQLLYSIGKDFQLFLDKQKNSTLKGKESEEKLESCLVKAFPHGQIICQSGKPQCCDFLVTRTNKPDILFENKDYNSNVPHEEIKKFIRDIEFQNKHGIMLSQNSGVTQKDDYQIDVHGSNIMIFVHFVHYDESKVRIAVNLVDHLHQVLEAHSNKTGLQISMEELSEINKEYLGFIGQKKSIIESTKKMHKDQIKALEDIEMPRLTYLLNAKFTNVEQLSYLCDICHSYSAKNRRALVTHKNKCKKKHLNLNAISDEDINEVSSPTDPQTPHDISHSNTPPLDENPDPNQFNPFAV